MFVATADSNYLLARSAFFKQLPFDFYWLSLHALEKYYKAILLMNGQSVKGFRHSLTELHNAVTALRPDIPIFAPTDPQMPKLRWHHEPLLNYLGRLDRFGNASNRYATYGQWLLTDDLLKIDQLIWSVRRCCRTFKWLVRNVQKTDVEVDEIAMLAINEKRWELGKGTLEALIKRRHEDPVRKEFLRMNVPFALGRKPTLRFEISMSHESPFTDWLRILKSAIGNSDNESNAEDVLQWAIDHIKLERRDRKTIAKALEDYRTALKKPLKMPT